MHYGAIPVGFTTFLDFTGISSRIALPGSDRFVALHTLGVPCHVNFGGNTVVATNEHPVIHMIGTQASAAPQVFYMEICTHIAAIRVGTANGRLFIRYW